MTTIWSGLALGSLYALVALGYNIVLVASGVFNFAYAQLLMLGVYLTYTAEVVLRSPLLGVVVFAAALVAVGAVLEERLAIRPIADRLGSHGTLITTVGVAALINGVVVLAWGTQPLTIPLAIDNTPLTIFGGTVEASDLLLIFLVPLAAIAIHFWNTRTLTGLASLAPAEDREAAMVCGINVRRVAIISFAISGLIAGGAGLLIGPQTYADPNLAQNLALLGFVAVAIGGSGHQLGGVVGGFVTGLAYSFAAQYLNATLADIFVFLGFLLVLLTRPHGILGKVAERHV
jgi:branched-chain amino acid transport system permease protein